MNRFSGFLKRSWGPLVLILAVAGSTVAGEVIDRVAAVVNEEIILLSEVDEKVFLLQAQGQLQGQDSTAVEQVRRDILDRLIEEKLVVQRAKTQGISIDETELLTAVDEAIDRVRGQFPNSESFEKAMKAEGLTMTQLRERYENDIRQERLAQRVVGREIRSQIEVTTEDVQRYYEEHQAELPTKPQEVRLAHFVVEPVTASDMQEALVSISAAWERLKDGTDFDVVKEGLVGGELGRFCSGDLAVEIEAVLDTLGEGVYSEPVRSVQGFHVFQITARDGECKELRHVMVPITVDAEAVQRAAAKAEGGRQRVLAGEQFADVAKDISDDQLTRDQGGDLGWTPTQTLLPEVTAALDSLAIGDLSPVIRSERGFHVFRALERRDGGAFAFEEIRDRLRQFIEAEELEKAYDDWLNAVRDSAYVEVKAWTR